MSTLVSSTKVKMSLERLISISGLVSSNLGALAPTVAKFLVLLLFLVNVRSWPLAWHIRVFRPVFRIQFQHKLLQLRSIFKSKAAKIQAEDEWLDSICPVGADPMNYVVRYNTSAGIDDCDFNGHLSNSSYAKTMDSARFKSGLAMFPMFFRAGGWIALAATHYNFIREIPMLAPYEVRLSIGAWDHKWVYVVAKFVTRPKSKKAKNASKTPKSLEQPTPSASDSETTGELFNASLRTPSSPSASGSTTPDTLKPLLASTEEPDGTTLHTISISQCCFKIGRITVPPAVVFAINGLSAPPSSSSESSAYSRTNPPPHWVKAKAISSIPRGGSTKKLRAFLKGGWKDIPEGERWWDEAMGGSVEERRAKGLEVIGLLGKGIGGARAL